jgi:outer membrane protein OmpA-like peptidoglycan-associated protein
MKRQEAARLEAERAAAAAREAQVRADEAAARVAAANARADAERSRVQAEAEAQRRVQAEQEQKLEFERRARAEAEQRLETERRAQAEADRARAEAEQKLESDRRAQAESERARAESDRARAEADRANAEAQARAEADRARQAAAQVEQERQALRNQLNVILETRETARGLIVNMSDVLFDTAKSTLKPGAREKLSKVAGILAAHPGIKLKVEGHTDSVGAASYNQRLSEDRAQAVRDYLVQSGIKPADISARGMGEDYPIATNDSAAGRQLNRRVELVVTGDVIGRPTTTE